VGQKSTDNFSSNPSGATEQPTKKYGRKFSIPTPKIKNRHETEHDGSPSDTYTPSLVRREIELSGGVEDPSIKTYKKSSLNIRFPSSQTEPSYADGYDPIQDIKGISAESDEPDENSPKSDQLGLDQITSSSDGTSPRKKKKKFQMRIPRKASVGAEPPSIYDDNALYTEGKPLSGKKSSMLTPPSRKKAYLKDTDYFSPGKSISMTSPKYQMDFETPSQASDFGEQNQNPETH